MTELLKMNSKSLQRVINSLSGFGTIKEAIEFLEESMKAAKASERIYVNYEVCAHDYKAGKAWIAYADENYAISKKGFLEPYSVKKEGYVLTKYYALSNGRYLCGTVGSKSHQTRIKLEIKDGKIVFEERYSH